MKISKKKGMSPGSVVFIGDRKAEKSSISVIEYNADNIMEKKDILITECAAFKDTDKISWIDVTGLHDVDAVAELGRIFDIHSLVLEDIVNTNQRPKIEIFDDHFFVVFKMLFSDPLTAGIQSEQVSLIVNEKTVISFQEREGDVFEPLRERIRQAKGRTRTMGSDYLAYSILDIIVDNYFEILEKLGEEMEILEEELIKAPGSKTLGKIYRMKREILSVRKAVWPLRDVVNRLEKGEITLINRKTMPFLRDLYDHIIQVIDNVEAMRDTVTGLLELYLSSVSFKMNDVMKVLTIISTIFIPLTFIAGVYGMNFENMPELKWSYGYFISLGLMSVIFVSMVIFFKKKKWW
jgi:magnesium transporter